LPGPDSDERLAALRAVANEAGCSPSQAIIAWMRQSEPGDPAHHRGEQDGAAAGEYSGPGHYLSSDQMQRLDTAGNPQVKQGMDPADLKG